MGRAKTTRERIVTAARQLFAEKGFDGATTAEIARQAGFAEGTIYRHFEDKKELFIACLEPAVGEGFDRWLTQIQQAADLRTIIRAMVQIRLQTIAENLDSFNILITEAPYHPELTELFMSRVLLTRIEHLRPALQKMAQTGELRRQPNFAILGLGLTMAIWVVLNFRDQAKAMQAHLPFPVTTENLLDDLTDFILYGIAGQSPGGET